MPWPGRVGVERESGHSQHSVSDPTLGTPLGSAVWLGEGLGQGKTRAFPGKEASGKRKGRQKEGKQQAGQKWKWVERR